MSVTVADLLTRFSADTSNLDSGTERSTKNLNAFQQTANTTFGTLRSVGNVALGVVGGGLLALGGGMAATAFSGLDLNRSMENVTAQLNAFTKDGNKSAEILEMIRERAAKTPFQFDEMARATAGLLPAAKASGEGLESLVEKAEILAASNPAQGLEGAAFALREAVSGDFTSIIERFNLPRQFINKLKDEGVPALEIVQRAMKEVGFDTDLVANLAETADGKWSTFKDTFQSIAATITEPIFDSFSAGLGTVNKWLSDNEPLLNRTAEAIGTALTAAMEAFGGLLPSTDEMLGGLLGTFTSVIETVAGVIQVFSEFAQSGELLSASEFGLSEQTAAVVDGIVDLILNIWDGINAVIEFVRPIVEAISKFVSWQDVLTALGIAIGVVIMPAILSFMATVAGIALVVGGVIAVVSFLRHAWEEDWGGIREKTAAVWDWLKTTFEAVQSWFNATFPNGLSDLLAIWSENWTAMQTAFEDVWGVLSAIWETIQGWFTETLPDALNSLQSSWETGWQNVSNATNTQWTTIRNTFDTVKGWLDTTLPDSVTSFNNDWQAGWENAKTSVSTQWALIQPTLETLKGWLDATLPVAMSGFSSAASAAWENARSSISGKIDAIIETFRNMQTWLTNTLQDALNSFKNALAGLTLSNPFTGMVTAIGSISTALTNAKATIISWVNWLQSLSIPNPFRSLTLPDWMTNLVGGGKSGKSRSGEVVNTGLDLGGGLLDLINAMTEQWLNNLGSTSEGNDSLIEIIKSNVSGALSGVIQSTMKSLLGDITNSAGGDMSLPGGDISESTNSAIGTTLVGQIKSIAESLLTSLTQPSNDDHTLVDLVKQNIQSAISSLIKSTIDGLLSDANTQTGGDPSLPDTSIVGASSVGARLAVRGSGGGFDVQTLALAIRQAFSDQPPIVRAEFAVSVSGTNDVESVSYEMARRVSEIIQRRAT